MKKTSFEACGIDVHKAMLKVCIVTKDLVRNQIWECENTGDAIRVLVKQLKRYGIKMVAFESTGIYWQLLYDILEPEFNVTLANPRHIKAIPGRKTDSNDAKWIATLLVKGLIKKSYVPAPELRQLRGFCRLKASLSAELTRYVNKQHKLLDQWDINVTMYFSSAKTLTCQYLLTGIANSRSWSELVENAPTKRIANELLRKQHGIEPYFEREFSQPARLELMVIRRLIETHEHEIARLGETIDQLASQLGLENQIAVVDSIAGIGRPSAIALLAEIGGIDKFPTGRHLTAWCGLCPSVYQSAGKNYTGRITKQGNRHVRRILHNCIAGCLRKKHTFLHSFYRRLSKKKPASKARVALMAKMLRIIHALLSKGETFKAYPEKGKKRSQSIPV